MDKYAKPVVKQDWRWQFIRDNPDCGRTNPPPLYPSVGDIKLAIKDFLTKNAAYDPKIVPADGQLAAYNRFLLLLRKSWKRNL